MSTWSRRALAAVTWVAVVAVGAVLVWVVISRAGAGLVADAGPVTAPTTTAATTDAAGADTQSPGPARQGRWEGDAGVVTALCQDAAIALVGAQPEDGVAVRVLDHGPDQLVVAFDGDDEGPVTVVGRCRGGRPQFTVSDTAPDPSSSSPAPTGGQSEGQPDGPSEGGSEGSDDGDGD